MTAEIFPSRLSGTTAAPPSKSMMHRLLLCAALAEGESTVTGISDSDDTAATLDCVRALGAAVHRTGNCVTVSGGRMRPAAVFPCRESGSTLRFFLPAALISGGKSFFQCAPRLAERGIGVYEDVLSGKGILFEKNEDGFSVSGSLFPGNYVLPGDVSSQYATGLLAALPCLPDDSCIRLLPPIESRPYIDLTLFVLRRYGIVVSEDTPGIFRIPGGQRYTAQKNTVEGDWSNAAALLAFRAAGGDVSVTGLDESSRQGDRIFPSLLDMLRGEKSDICISDRPDLGPVLFASAALLHGAHFTGTRRLRDKESDRIAAMAEAFDGFGISYRVGENTFDVLPGVLHAPTKPLNAHGDHRIVMALTLLASVTGGTISGAEAVSKSFPEYFDILQTLGLKMRFLH